MSSETKRETNYSINNKWKQQHAQHAHHLSVHVERTLSHLMSSHTSLAQVLSLFTFIHGHHHGAPSLTRFSLSTSTCSSLFSFPSTSSTPSCTLSSTNPIVMESLCYSANKESEEAYDVSTSLTGYEPNYMAFNELNDSSGSFSYITPSSDQDMKWRDTRQAAHRGTPRTSQFTANQRGVSVSEIPLQGGSHASSSHEVSLEPTFKRRGDLCEHNVHTHFPKDRNCEIWKRTKITRAPSRRRNDEAVLRATNFGDLITADHKVPKRHLRISKQSPICSRGAGLSHSMEPDVSVHKQNFTRKPREACESSWNPRGNQKSFTLTMPWNSAKLLKISPGIIARLHHIDRRQTALQKEQCAELKKVPLLYCCNQVWMKVGGQILWNVTSICETSQIYYLMGRRPMKDVLGNHFNDRLFRLVHWLSIILLLRRIGQEYINLERKSYLDCSSDTHCTRWEFGRVTYWLQILSSWKRWTHRKSIREDSKRKRWYFPNKENFYFSNRRWTDQKLLEEIRNWEHPPWCDIDQFEEKITLIFLNQKGLLQHLTTRFQMSVKQSMTSGPCPESSCTAIMLNPESIFMCRTKNHALFHQNTLTYPELLTSRPDHLWPELLEKKRKNAKLKEKQKWSNEKLHLENAWKLRRIYFIDPEDKEFEKPSRTSVRSWKHQSLLLCLAKLWRRIVGVVHPTRLACILEACESTKFRMGEPLPILHEDILLEKEKIPDSTNNLVHKFIPMPQVMKIPKHQK